MSGELYVQPEGVRSYAKIHEQVASGISQLTSSAADATGVQTSHGTIAAAVGTALSGVLGSRQGTMSATAVSSSTISEILEASLQRYEQGDREGAEKLRAAAAALQESGAGEGTGTAGTTATSGSSGTGGVTGTGATSGSGSPGGSDAASGASTAGQMVGQVVGQVGALGQTLGQSVSGLVSGLSQIPQQVMQAVQGGTGDKADPNSKEKDDRGKQTDDRTKEQDGPSDKAPTPTDDHAPAQSSGHAPTGAAPGESQGTGHAPAERPAPAQTRPQGDQSPL